VVSGAGIILWATIESDILIRRQLDGWRTFDCNIEKVLRFWLQAVLLRVPVHLHPNRPAISIELLLFLLAAVACAGQSMSGTVRSLSFAEALPVITAHRADLPSDFPEEATSDPKAWANYVEKRSRELRARLEQGDLDSLANLLLFGTSYTKAPVITPESLRNIVAEMSQLEAAGASLNPYQARLRDLTLGLATPGQNARLRYMRRLLEKKGVEFETPPDLDKAQRFLAENLVRMLRDDQKYAAALEEARKEDENVHFKKRSQVFEQRGISVDTSIFPNFAVEEALAKIKKNGLLKAGSVLRIAIVGPGLDVINKDVGFDFYPEQTIQLFALADSLLKLGLTRAVSQLSITTLDISQNVNSHLANARKQALAGKGYTLQIPLRENVNWTKEAVNYWEEFGKRIGTPVQGIPAPASAGTVRSRAVHIRPGILLRIRPIDLNVVLQSLDLPQHEKFDVILGTNIFVYYGAFEQSLAEINLAKMLKPGGVVLTNDALPNEPDLPLEEVDFSTTVYSDRNADGDRIVWMRLRRVHSGNSARN
jgi:SAM-dependent methyltransferase